MHRKILVCALWLFLSVVLCPAADIQALVNETQRLSQKPDAVTMVWWIPTEFWRQSLSKNSNLTKKQVDDFLNLLDGYAVFAVVAANIGPTGALHAKPTDDVRKNVQLKVGTQVVGLLNDETVSPDARNLIAMMKPVISNMVGEFGKSMEFCLYPNGKEGPVVLSPTKEGNFTYSVFGEVFEWQLPLGSCLPPRFDAKTGREFPGNYRFNPFTGDKLVEKKP